MYQGRLLKNFYHIDENTYIFQFEDGSKELMTFNSFFISIGKEQIPIDKIIDKYKFMYSYDMEHSTAKSALHFKNLSKNKMLTLPYVNQSGFNTSVHYYPFKSIEKDFIGITFDIHFKSNEFKVLMYITKKGIKFIPIIFNSTKDGIGSIINSKTYYYIKLFMSQNFDFNLPHNRRFTFMLKDCNILDRNSHSVYNIS